MDKRIQGINDFLSYEKTSALSFRGLKDKSVYDLELNDLVYECIRLTLNHYSLNSGIPETMPGKWRSALDIWRHVKFFKPETTIFQTLTSIYQINSRLVGHFCPTINKRAFKVKADIPHWGLQDKGYIDEFSLRFPEWEKIESLAKKEEEISVKK